jgi:putative transposase
VTNVPVGSWGTSVYTWIGDFDADGRSDIASASGGNVYMRLSTGTGFSEDYLFYRHHLRELATRFGCALHAYVLMTNHVHPLLTPATKADNASLLMKHLGQRYVQYVNRSYRRSGTLWEGRFRSCLAQSEDYVLVCYRYIELNPVRAAMVRQPQDYRWSSFPANAQGKADALLTAHEQYVRLGKDAAQRHEAYRALFKAHLDEEMLTQIRQATNGGYTLGAGRFQAHIARALGRRVVKGKAGRPPVSTDQESGELEFG